MKRRQFVKNLISATGISLMSCPVFSASVQKRIHLESPFDGAVIHQRSGFPLKEVLYKNQKAEKLKIEIRGTVDAENGFQIKITDSKEPSKTIPVKISGRTFLADVLLTDRLTNLIVTLLDSTGRILESTRSRVIWLKNSYRRFRCFIDDNIYCLRDIQSKNLKSLFDSEYMGRLREFHRQYGVKFMLNMFYRTPEKDFCLSDFSNRYRSEWRDNADWLQMAFHAREEFPDRSFLTMSREQLAADIDLIQNEIVRIAGEGSLAPTTCLHWGAIDREMLSLFVRRGTKVFCNGLWALSMPGFLDKYQVPGEALYYLSKNDAWYDFKHGLLFAGGEVCCNVLENTPARLTKLLKESMLNKNTGELMSIMTHEPYFWSFYKGYIPDHWARFDASFRFVTENGYKPAFPQDAPFSELVDELRREVPLVDGVI